MFCDLERLREMEDGRLGSLLRKAQEANQENRRQIELVESGLQARINQSDLDDPLGVRFSIAWNELIIQQVNLIFDQRKDLEAYLSLNKATLKYRR